MKMISMTPLRIAAVAHEINRAYCEANGDTSQVPWQGAPEEIKQSAVNGVLAITNNPELTPEQSHANWKAFKEAEGWVYGEVKDMEAKTHPYMVPYSELSVEQQTKYYLFTATVRTLLNLHGV